jgi:hypothetical protein
VSIVFKTNWGADKPKLQIIKLFGKLEGQTVFAGGMHMGKNEYQEICSTLLTPTKAHNQYMPSLRAIQRSLKMYGHEPTQLSFTDNVWGDKAELEKVILLLRKDVVPVPDISTLEKLTVPIEWNVSTLLSTFQVNAQLNSILDQLGDSDDLFVVIGIAFPVDHENGIQGKVGLLLIGLEHEIFLLPVGFPLAWSKLAQILIIYLKLHDYWW